MSGVETAVEGHRIEPLTPQTWAAFADLAERDNGVFGGCWWLWFRCHPDPPERKEIGNRAFKQRMVQEGRAPCRAGLRRRRGHRLGGVRHRRRAAQHHDRKEWEQTVEQVPDFRITCLFVDRPPARRCPGRHGQASR